MKRLRRVALLIETSKAYGRGLLWGIRRYVKEHGAWSIFLEPRALGSTPPKWLTSWDGDGIIARVSDVRIARVVLRSRLPVVNLSAALPELRLPYIGTSPEGMARMAAAHFWERGLRRAGYLGDARNHPRWSRAVGDAFVSAMRAHGGDCRVLGGLRQSARARAMPWEQEQALLGRWVADLPKPVGIFAVTDPRGHNLLEACRRVGVSVPEQVAVLGNENDDLICDFCTPPMSSIAPNAEKVGYEAARTLDRWMDGGPPSLTPVNIEPLRVVTRQSTDIQAHEDPIVGNALRFIRERACTGIRVQDVIDHVGVSRSNLDQRFSRALGRSPHDEIVRLQLERAMDLLAHTPLKTLAVAEKAGFRHVEYMGQVLRKKLGVTPAEYRRSRQRGEDGAGPSADSEP